jgi:uncharacterized protein YndB with AHSA1/START domain
VIVINATIRIQRGIDDVFAYVAAPEHFPAWNSAVTDVQPLSAAGDHAAFVMIRQLPTGVATNELRVVAVEPPRRFVLETTSGPTPFHYEYRFSEDDHATTIELDAQADLGTLATLLGPLARHGLEHGIRANLETLKGLLERHGRSAG